MLSRCIEINKKGLFARVNQTVKITLEMPQKVTSRHSRDLNKLAKVKISGSIVVN